MPLVGIYILVYREGVGLYAFVFDAVETRLPELREVDLDVVVPVVEHAPFLGLHLHCDGLASVRIDAEHLRLRSETVILVKFDHCHLLLCRGVAHLGYADVRLAHPVLRYARLEIPLQDFACLASRKQGAEHEGAVLREMTAVVDADFLI